MTYICFCDNTDFLECQDNSRQNKTSVLENKLSSASNASTKISNCTCRGIIEVALLFLLSVAAVFFIALLFHVLIKKFKTYLTLRQKRQLWMQTYSASPKKYAVFLAFCSENDQFVTKYVFPHLNSGLQKVLKTENRCVSTGAFDLRPGFPIAMEIMRCIEECSVFISVVTNSFCRKSWCRYEVMVACSDFKPVILMMCGKVKTKLMPDMLRKHYDMYTRVNWTINDGEPVMTPSWEHLCDNIVRLIGTNTLP